MPVSSTRFDQLLEALDCHNIAYDPDSLPLPEQSQKGSETAFEEALLEELIEQNPEFGFGLDSTHDYENPDEELYLDILKVLLYIAGLEASVAELGNAMDENGLETVTLVIGDMESSWTGDIEEEYIDTDILQSMLHTDFLEGFLWRAPWRRVERRRQRGQ